MHESDRITTQMQIKKTRKNNKQTDKLIQRHTDTKAERWRETQRKIEIGSDRGRKN